jgi:hypothetical protein
MRSNLWGKILQLASAEQGALLWVPCLLVAIWLTLFGLRMAPGGSSMFTRTTSLRVAVGPWSAGRIRARRVRSCVASRRRRAR